MGLTNVIVMIPFCRTLEEADKVLEVMAAEGLRRGENGLKVYVMAEIPSDILLAQHFAERLDGFSIGSDDSPGSLSASTATPKPSPTSSTRTTRPSPTSSGCSSHGYRPRDVR